MKRALFNGQAGTIVGEQAGRVLVYFDDHVWSWIIRGIPGLEIVEQKRGRPRKHLASSDRQRSYRERKAGKALRKYTRRVNG